MLNNILDFLGNNPQWMGFIVIAAPLIVLLVWSVYEDRQRVRTAQNRHRRTRSSIKRDVYFGPDIERIVAHSDDSDYFKKVTHYYNTV